jgi:hypothetical protein
MIFIIHIWIKKKQVDLLFFLILKVTYFASINLKT